MNRLLCIDPGKTAGWAYFEDGKLAACGKTKNILKEWLVNPENLHVVVESQRIYPSIRKEGIPDNDIVSLARTAGEISGFYLAGRASTEYVFPREWKGTVPKRITEKRVLAVADSEEYRLIYSTKSDRAKSLDNNMIDAIGIGYWKLGRKYRSETK